MSATVLIVDDENDLREAIALDFGRKGYRTVAAESGSSAKNILETSQVDVIVSDVNMPNGDGIELLKWLRARDRKMPFLIFITAYSDLLDEEVYDLGAHAILPKPLNRKALFKTVARCLLPRDTAWDPAANEPQGAPSKTIRGSRASLGSGGVFIEDPEFLPETGERVSIEAVVGNTAGAPISITGTGIARWARRTPDKGLPIGTGIEFESLADSCRIPVIDRIESLPETSFIPKV
jgi:CheY-like chemotaxis protein